MSWEDYAESTSDSTSFQALVNKVIDPNLLEYVRKYDQLDAAIPTISWETDVYYFNRRDGMPEAQAVTETGSASDSVSNYSQNNFRIKHYQTNGNLSDIAIQIARAGVPNLLEKELTGHAQVVRWMRAMEHMYGDSNATAGSQRPQWDGFDTQVGNGNKITPTAGAGGAISFADLDNLIDQIESNLGGPLPDEDYFFNAWPKLLSSIARLHSNDRRVQMTTKLQSYRDNGTVGSPVLMVDSGFEVPTYRGIALTKSSFLQPSGTMSAITLSAAGADGTLPATAVFYTVDAVTKDGFTYATGAQSITPTLNNHVDITFTKPIINDAFGHAKSILLYRVYKGTGSGTMSLYAVVSAKDSLDNDTVVIRDFGSSVSAGSAALANPVAGSLYGADTTHGNGYEAPIFSGNVGHLQLWTRNPDFVVCPTLNELKTVMLAKISARTTQFALTGDCTLAVRAPLFLAKLLNVSS